jgi:hypothetical protein
LAVKVDLEGLDTDNLYFYVFKHSSNRYVELETEYEIDDDGMLHFTTPVGGNVIITDSPLHRR